MDLKAAAPAPRRHVPWRKPDNARTTIGVIDPCYGSSRVVYGLPTERYVHRRMTTLTLRRLDRSSTFFAFTPAVLDWNVDLLHTWNTIPINKQFLLSFELEIPRYLGQPRDREIRFGLDQLCTDRCRGLLPLSDFAKRHAQRVFAEYGYRQLDSKLTVFRGGVWDPFADGQARPRQESNEPEKPLTAILIGTQQFRKGGMYAIEAFERLRARGMDVRLTLVGDFEASCYAFRSELPDASIWRKRAHSCPWITVMPPVPFAEVYRLLLAHDICLYPSIDESLGWLPIEAAMAGKPVIGARIGAFPEFVHHLETGWLINIDVGPNERWNGLSLSGSSLKKALQRVRECMVDGISEAVEKMYFDRNVCERWGIRGRELMQRLYNVEAAGIALSSIYDGAI